MSRTKHHRHQHRRKWGLDFGARYKANKCYCGGSGSIVKDMADRERRNDSKVIIQNEDLES